jgi:hypothetical protein
MDKYHCPLCANKVKTNSDFDCVLCKKCDQYMHHLCLINYTKDIYKYVKERLLKHDILICPGCGGNEIFYCVESHEDMNKGMKEEVLKNPNRKGGKRKNHKKSKKSIKNRRSRKTRKTRK